MGSSKETFLRGLGIQATEVSGSRMMKVAHTALFRPAADDPVWGWAHEPRSLEPADVDIVNSMAARYEARAQSVNEKVITVAAQPIETPRGHVLLVQNGNRRATAADAAAALLRRRGVLAKDAPLIVLVEFVPCDFESAEARALFIADRSRLNTDPTQKPDTATILAYRVEQLLSQGMSAGDIATRWGRRRSEVEALERWDEVAASVQRKVDAGEIPIALLPELVTVPKGAQEERAAELQAQGVKTSKGATQRRNKAVEARDPWARPMGRRALWNVGKAVGETVTGGNRYAEGVADALKLASLTGEDAKKHLDNMPRKVADAIRKARAGS